MNLAALLGALPGSYRDRLSSMVIERRGDHWCAILSYAIYPSTTLGGDIGPYSVAVDARDLPPGVRAFGWERLPDSVHALAIPGEVIDPTDEVADMLRAVHASRVVGGLDAARFDGGGYPHWIITAHAGSAAERRAWTLSNGPHAP